MIGQTFQDIAHPDDLDLDVAQATALGAGEIDHHLMNNRYVRKDGSHVWIQLHASLVWEDSKFLTFIAPIIDIDDSVRLQETLERQDDELEHFAFLANDLQNHVRVLNEDTEPSPTDLNVRIDRAITLPAD